MPVTQEHVHPATRAEWRRWLAAHHDTATGVWLVSWRAHTKRKTVTYDEQVEEALAYGWVDSRPGTVDADRTKLYFSPRKKGSAWSRPNKERIARLEQAGRLADAGRRAVEAAKADGSWTRLDAVEDGVVPDDLAAEFDRRPGSREQFDGFPRSVRRSILEWIVQAKKPETRAKRVEETARLAERGERANQWRPPTR